MVVDDDDNVREMMRGALELEGYRVLAARNGTDALNVAARHATRIHLIVCDVRMPEMGGTELVEAVRRWWPGLRCLMVSGYSDFSYRLEAFGGAPTEFLSKPFSVDTLAATVRELLDRPARPNRSTPASSRARQGSRINEATPSDPPASVPTMPDVSVDDIARIADEIVAAMQSPAADPRLKRFPNGQIRVLTSVVFPAGSAAAETLETRRQSLSREVEERLTERGWQRVRANVFSRSESPSRRYRMKQPSAKASPAFAALDLSLIAAEQRNSALAQLRDGDIVGFLRATSSELRIAIVVGNVAYLRGRSLLEPAVVEVFNVRPTNNHHVYRDLEFLLRRADRARLRAAGDPLPGDGPWTVFRGVGGRGANRRIRGYSWTANLERARWFAERASTIGLEHSAVYATTISAESVLFYRHGSDERDFAVLLDTQHPITRVP